MFTEPANELVSNGVVGQIPDEPPKDDAGKMLLESGFLFLDFANTQAASKQSLLLQESEQLPGQLGGESRVPPLPSSSEPETVRAEQADVGHTYHHAPCWGPRQASLINHHTWLCSSCCSRPVDHVPYLQMFWAVCWGSRGRLGVAPGIQQAEARDAGEHLTMHGI